MIYLRGTTEHRCDICKHNGTDLNKENHLLIEFHNNSHNRVQLELILFAPTLRIWLMMKLHAINGDGLTGHANNLQLSPGRIALFTCIRADLENMTSKPAQSTLTWTQAITVIYRDLR